MKCSMIRALCLLLLTCAGAQGGLSHLEALGMIESGNNDRAIGRDGEVSRYQILPRVWRQYSSSSTYTDPRQAAVIAQKHLHFLDAAFRKKAGREPTDFDRYVMWNAGLHYYQRAEFRPARVARIVRERAQRYVNLREQGDLAGTRAQKPDANSARSKIGRAS